MRVQAAILERPDGRLTRHKIQIEDVELEAPRADEVLIKVTSCGVCGTDRGCIHGIEPYPSPGVLGHEGAGIVEDLGSDVTLVKRGDRVVIGFPFCGVCRYCRAGQMRYCQYGNDLMFGGRRLDRSTPMRRADGGGELAGRFFQQSSWATHTIAQERQLVVVPDGIDHDLFGPLGCSITTGAGTVLNELKPAPGSSLAIFGSGAVGLAAVMAARLTGVRKIIAIDTNESRLALARDLGATHVFESGPSLVEQIKDLTDGGVDYAIESTDGANLAAEACASLAKLGTCAIVGGAKPTAAIELNQSDMLLKGKRLIGVMGGGGQTPAFHLALMHLQAEGRFPLERLVKTYPFADVNKAIDDSDAGSVVKPVLMMG